MKIVATTSLPAVDRPNADRWNAARSRQKLAKIRSMLLEDLKTTNTFYFQTNKMKDTDVSKNIHISTIMETQMDH